MYITHQYTYVPLHSNGISIVNYIDDIIARVLTRVHAHAFSLRSAGWVEDSTCRLASNPLTISLLTVLKGVPPTSLAASALTFMESNLTATSVSLLRGNCAARQAPPGSNALSAVSCFSRISVNGEGGITSRTCTHVNVHNICIQVMCIYCACVGKCVYMYLCEPIRTYMSKCMYLLRIQ